MDYINMSIGSVLKDRRINLNIKQEDIAEQMKVTVQTVSKWERDITEPKATQVSKLSQILKISEKEICQGDIQNQRIDPLDFVRRVGILMQHVPHTEMLIGMHKYINDTEGFINMLSQVSEYPFELFDIEERENELFQAKLMLDAIENGHVMASEDTIQKAKEHAIKVIAKNK
ncbi:helix-turn-helix transcriptional regulator [Vibrio genomosp. F6]|uniref:helix-turn-helix domain-containing protein n=1 Tax=Vibrio genomosp. F6 TaxID=723172 RepID=UPI0010BD6EA1|nr:helix-turn-helix transcriptional regulator [Vibrio genomosp. F6]TKF20761.1 helix-turn-helix transcriptional regulator [Vibrio genomosp. F6]